MVDSIEANVESASIRVNEGADELRMAERYQVPLAHSYIHAILILFAFWHPFPFRSLLSCSHLS